LGQGDVTEFCTQAYARVGHAALEGAGEVLDANLAEVDIDVSYGGQAGGVELEGDGVVADGAALVNNDGGCSGRSVSSASAANGFGFSAEAEFQGGVGVGPLLDVGQVFTEYSALVQGVLDGDDVANGAAGEGY